MKLFLAAFVMMATVTFTACGDKDNDPEEQSYQASATFDILYSGQAVAAGATVEYALTAEEVSFDDCEVSLYVKNKSNATVQRVFKVELSDGPSSMANAPICYGQCTEHQLPYTSEAVAIAAGTTDSKPIQIHLYPSQHGDAHSGTYKVTVGKGANLEDPQVCFVKFIW